MANKSIFKAAIALAAVLGAVNADAAASCPTGGAAVDQSQLTGFHIGCLANNLVGASGHVAEGQQCADFMVPLSSAYDLLKTYMTSRGLGDLKNFQNTLCVNTDTGIAIDDHGMSCEALTGQGILPQPYETYLTYVKNTLSTYFPGVSFEGVPRNSSLQFPDTSRICGYLFSQLSGPDLNPAPISKPASTQSASQPTPTTSATAGSGSSSNSGSGSSGSNASGSGSSGSSSSGSGSSGSGSSGQGAGAGTGSGSSASGTIGSGPHSTLTASPAQKSGAAVGRFAFENCVLALGGALAFAAFIL